jgi:hypothetical protein
MGVDMDDGEGVSPEVEDTVMCLWWSSLVDEIVPNEKKKKHVKREVIKKEKKRLTSMT